HLAVLVEVANGYASGVRRKSKVGPVGVVLESFAFDIAVDVAAQDEVFPAVSVKIDKGCEITGSIRSGNSQQTHFRSHIFEFSARNTLVQNILFNIHDELVGNAIGIELAKIPPAGNGNPFFGKFPVIMQPGWINVPFPGGVAEQ